MSHTWHTLSEQIDKLELISSRASATKVNEIELINVTKQIEEIKCTNV